MIKTQAHRAIFGSILLLGSVASSQTLYNDSSRNIHDTFDPICDGTDASIVWCDGFEDGTYWDPPTARQGWASNNRDGWKAGNFFGDNSGAPNPSLCALSCSNNASCAGNRLDPKDQSYTECNAGPINPNLADFGAAGTPCTATMDWVSDGVGPGSDSDTMQGCAATHGRDASHFIMIDNRSENPPSSANQFPIAPTGTYELYIRFYFKETGVTSSRCPSGAGNCPPFKNFGPNGYKALEQSGNGDTGGIAGGVIGTVNTPGSGGRELFGMGLGCDNPQPAAMLQQGDCTGSSICDNGGRGPGTQFVHANHRDEWIFFEAYRKQTSTGGTFRIWMDACGRDGLGCTGTPTLRSEMTGQDYTPKGGRCATPASGIEHNKVRALWFNFWNKRQNGEIQFDEIVVRNAEVLNEPIGFAPIFGGASAAPAPPAAPVLLD